MLRALFAVALLTASLSSIAQRVPDASMTPGHATYHTKKTVCTLHTKDERYVPESVKNGVYEKYGVAKCSGYCVGPQGCEVDHLISLELGGANTEDNLWPQPYDGEWSAHDKDRLETRLHSLVCGKKKPDAAQGCARGDPHGLGSGL